MDLVDVLERTRQLTERDLEHKSMSEIVLSAAEEFGEFARELKIEEGVFGNSHKDAGEDGSVGEAVDMIIMALALYYARYSKVTGNPASLATPQLPAKMMAKLNKWDKNQMRERGEIK